MHRDLWESLTGQLGAACFFTGWLMVLTWVLLGLIVASVFA